MERICASEMSLEIVLDEDLRLRIRGVRPEDKALLQKGVQQLSARSTYQRFFTPIVRFTEDDLRYLTEVDGRDHCALGAIDLSQEEPAGVGIARYIRLPDEPEVAEAAVSVIDAYQGRGIGSLLLVALSRCAVENGVERLRGYLLETNRRFIRYLTALGATQQVVESGVVRIDLPVYRRLRELPRTPETERVRRAWRQIDRALSRE